MSQQNTRSWSELPQQVIKALVAIRDRYGASANRVLGESPEEKTLVANRWASVIGSYPAPAVQEATQRCLRAHPKSPPSLEQFEHMCRRVTDAADVNGDSVAMDEARVSASAIPSGGHPSHRSAQPEIQRRRSHEPASRETYERHMAAIRANLKDSRLANTFADKESQRKASR